MNEHQAHVSAALYDLAMTLTDQGVKNVDSLILRFCLLAGVPYPPQQH